MGRARECGGKSGREEEWREKLWGWGRPGDARVYTDPVASPTGFTFKVVLMEDTHSDAATYENRSRICDLSYLRHAYKKPDGTLGWRCPSEPVEDYLRKGGKGEDTHGRKCVCNGLLANISLSSTRRGELEKPLFTSGADVSNVSRFLNPRANSYRAVDVLEYLLRDTKVATVHPAQKAYAAS